jgi:hypothetical protein
MRKFNKIGTSFISTFLLGLLLAACHHQPKNPKLSDEWHPLSKSQRNQLIKKSTKNYQYYNGLDLLFDVNVTFLNERILEDNLKMRSQYLMWDASQAKDELSKLELEKVNSSYFFVTVYSNNRKLNQLNLKAANWTATIILSDGTVYHGKIKLNDNINHHNTVFFPHVESWDKSYMVSFDVPTSKLTQDKFIFDITSPRGSARFEF